MRSILLLSTLIISLNAYSVEYEIITKNRREYIEAIKNILTTMILTSKIQPLPYLMTDHLYFLDKKTEEGGTFMGNTDDDSDVCTHTIEKNRYLYKKSTSRIMQITHFKYTNIKKINPSGNYVCPETENDDIEVLSASDDKSPDAIKSATIKRLTKYFELVSNANYQIPADSETRLFFNDKTLRIKNEFDRTYTRTNNGSYSYLEENLESNAHPIELSDKESSDLFSLLRGNSTMTKEGFKSIRIKYTNQPYGFDFQYGFETEDLNTDPSAIHFKYYINDFLNIRSSHYETEGLIK